MYYFPNSMNPENNINTQSFFLTPGQGLEYYNDAVQNKISNFTIEYGTVWKGIDVPYSNQNDIQIVRSIVRSYTNPILKGIILESSMSNNTFYSNSEGDTTAGTVGFPQLLSFHLYQPITLHGLKIDENFQGNFPTVPYIPAFLWYYTRDYQLMKEMDATLNFLLGVAFDVGLFFISGGVGMIKNFSYLRYVTEIGRAFKAGQGTAYTVLVLEGFGSGAEIFTLLSSTCTRYYDYMKQKADAGEDTTQYEALHKMFFYLTILGAGASFAVKSLAINQAKVVKGAIYFDSLPLEVRNAVNSLAGVEVAQLDNFRTKINPYQKISSKFDSWLEEGKKNVFFEDFKSVSNDVLQQLNDDAVIANWEKLYAKNIIDRNSIDVITSNAKTNTIIKYYEPYKLRQWLRALRNDERWEFLKDFENIEDDIFTKMSNNTMCANLLQQAQRKDLAATYKNFISIKDTKEIIKYVNNESKLEVLYIRNKLLNFTESGKVFRRNINRIEIPINDVKIIRNDYITKLKPFLVDQNDAILIEQLSNVNFMPTKFKVFNANGQLEKVVEKTFISGTYNNLNKLFGDNLNQIESQFNIHIATKDFEFMNFTKAAKEDVLSSTLSSRFNDTEQHMLNEYFKLYSYGKTIEIETTSVLWSCPSCQLYLGATTEFIKSINSGSINKLKITFKGNTKLLLMKESRKNYLDL